MKQNIVCLFFVALTCHGSFQKETYLKNEDSEGRTSTFVKYTYNGEYVANVSEMRTKDDELIFRAEFYGCGSDRCSLSIGIHEDGKISYGFSSKGDVHIRCEDTDRDGLPNFIWLEREQSETRLKRTPAGELLLWSDEQEIYIEPDDADNPVNAPENPENQPDD
ncbi:MAG: hypothetical protein AAGJ81_12170 [Verrucomicrobiota bacterium]